VVDRLGDRLRAKVEEGGRLPDHSGVSFPETRLRVPAVTAKDQADLEFGRLLDVDYVAASFVRSAADVEAVAALTAAGTPIIAKIELASAYENLGDILSASQGAMVARGDLGVELPLERIPLVQKEVLERTNAAGLMSITATEMLESMVKSSRPTRAEVTDVANAVLAGTDAVMLSAETAVGEFPEQAVRYMARICREVEAHMERPATGHVHFLASHPTFPSAVANAAVEAADNLGLQAIVVFTESGGTALLLSKYRPHADIVAFTPDERTLRRMALYWGVTPRPFVRLTHTDDMISAAERYLAESGVCQPGEGVVMVAGVPPNERATTNLMKLHTIGDVADPAPPG
jgi:pyruvate kinase